MFLLTVVACVAMAVCGWNAWTGRWRAWAHPTSGWGCVPVLFLPLGLGLIPMVLDDANGEMSGWGVILGFPALVAWFLLVLHITRLLRRWPRWLRPRWLPEDAPTPRLARHPKVILPGRTNPDSSESLATRGLNVRVRRARWAVFYLGGPPGYRTGALTGVRWCRLEVYDRALAIFQQHTEDHLYEDAFWVTLRPGEVERLEFAPGLALHWRAVLWPDPLHAPQLILRLPGGSAHHLAVRSLRFRRDLKKSLQLVASTLKVAIPA